MAFQNNFDNVLATQLMRITAIVLLLITGVGALAAGYGFMSDPSGKGLGMSTDYIRFSPFADFLIPGIILFCFIGVSSVVIALAAIMKAKHFPLYSFIQGWILSGWIAVQVILVRDFNWLHLTFLIVGILLILSGKMLMIKGQ